MQFHIQHIAPVFLEEEKIRQSAIWNHDLVFHKGEKIQVVAPSGSGKTSLIHFLYGERNDYDGTVSFDGKPLKEFDAEALARYRKQHASIIFQDLRLFHEHTVQQNIEVKRNLAPYGENKINSMAGRLGIANKLNKFVKTCSYGEQQRIAIIRALQQPFDFLLMDEPFSHLDDLNRQKAMELILEEASQRGAGVILADLDKVNDYKADRIINL